MYDKKTKNEFGELTQKIADELGVLDAKSVIVIISDVKKIISQSIQSRRDEAAKAVEQFDNEISILSDRV